jgi:MFS family permease
MATTSSSQALVAVPETGRRLMWSLGLGAFGLAFSITTTAAYLPPLLNRFTSSGGLIGVILGAEGVFALALSPVIGPWSDTFHTPMGRRRPFMPDVLPPQLFGRSQGIQHILRGIAIGIALVVGGLLFKVWRPSPFLLAAVLTTAACGATIYLVREDGGHGRVFEGFAAYIRRSWHIFWEDGDVRRFLIANSAWEGTFAAARTFVVLYITVGLGQSKVMSSAVLGAVAVGYVIAAIFAGRLGDRFGLARVIFFASWIYGGGYLVGGFAQEWHDWYFGLIIVVAIAGGTVMTLAWGLLYKIVPVHHRGAVSGLATTTKGIGLLVGAPIAGLAIDLSRPYLSATDGYQILWPICAIPILAAIPLLVRLMEVEPRTKMEPDVPAAV